MSQKDGFTLIEIIVYMALFSLVVGGFLIVTYGIIQGAGRVQSKIELNEEGEFLIRKFDWAVSGGSSVITSATTLQVTKQSLPAAENPLVFSLNSGNLLLKRGGSTSTLNTADVTVATTSFSYNAASGTVRMQFTLSNLSETQSFDVTRYLR